jgi:hypothetical protein
VDFQKHCPVFGHLAQFVKVGAFDGWLAPLQFTFIERNRPATPCGVRAAR